LVNAGAKVVDLCETTKFCGLFFCSAPLLLAKGWGRGGEALLKTGGCPNVAQGNV